MFYSKIKNTSIILYILSVININGCSKAIKPINNHEQPENTVLLISIDGFKWNYIEKASTPNFDKFIHEGIRSEGLIPSFPSKTFPSHITIVTGRHPSNHGIISNRMFDPIFNEYY